MNAWKATPFSKLLVDSKDGEWGESEEAVGLREVTIIRGTDFSDLNNPDAEFPQRWVKAHIVERKRLQRGDIILETAGGTSTQSTGRSALLKDSFFLRHASLPVLCASFSRHLRLNTTDYSPQFVYYLLQTLHRTGYMGVFNIQHTGVSRFQYTTFKNHTELRIPELPIQRRIAAILGAYDELIENNAYRIALLEKLAEEIYREWFVRIRFPGYEKVRKVKGVPEGWTNKKFSQFCKLKRGYDLPDANVEPGPHPVIASTSIKTYHAHFKVEPPVITTGRSGSLGKVLFVNAPAWPLNTTLYVKEFFGNSPFLIYYTLKNMKLELFNAGAGVPTLNRNHLSGIPITVPNKELQNQFDVIVAQMHGQSELLRRTNDNLIATRDQLLPRLISGKLSLDNLEIQFPAEMTEVSKTESGTTFHA